MNKSFTYYTTTKNCNVFGTGVSNYDIEMGFFTLRPHQLFDTVPKYNVSYVIDLKARH